MKVLITEDDDKKRDDIASFVRSFGIANDRIITASNMAECAEKYDQDVGLCIIDLRLPAYDGGSEDTNGIGVLQTIDRLGGGRVRLIAISSYPEEFEAIRSRFESRGCMLVSYEQRDVWQNVLRQMLIQAKSIETLDFLVFCALRDERKPYTAMQQLAGTPVYKQNVARYDVTLSKRSGSIIELPRMGLVDAAAHAATCIERFKPKVVGMSGICAGFSERAKIGQLLVSEMAYEYQSGKWTTDGFSQEPYQVPLAEDVRNVVAELTEDDGLLQELEAGWSGDRPSEMSRPRLASFTSGSAVIASEDVIAQVSNYHRRVAGLDMEVFAIHRAAHVASCKPDVICAKTVLTCGVGKDDKLQMYGSFISAKFIVKALAAYFSKK